MACYETVVSISSLLVADGDAHAHTTTIFLTVREMKRHVPKAYAVLVSRMGPLDVENDNGTAAAARLRHAHIASAAPCNLETRGLGYNKLLFRKAL